MLFFQNHQLVRCYVNGRSGVSRRQSNKVDKYPKGRAERKEVLNFVLLMDKTQNAANPPKADYPQEVGMESRCKAEEQSYVKACTEGRNKISLNTRYLLEIIFEKGNLNQAYKRVKKNGGSHGIDKMKTEETSVFLTRT